MKKFLKNTFAVLFILAACFSVTGCQKIADYINSYATIGVERYSHYDLVVTKIMVHETSGNGWETKYEVDTDEDEIPSTKPYFYLQAGTYDFNISGYQFVDGKYLWSNSNKLPFTANGSGITIDAGANLIVYYDKTTVSVNQSDCDD